MSRKYSVRLTRRAERNIRNIGDRIAVDSPRRADEFIARLIDEIEMLRRFPLRCPPAREGIRRGRQLRQLVVFPYRVVFAVVNDDVVVYHVRHSARRP